MTDSHTDICEQRKVPRGQQMAATREVRCLTWTAKMTEGFGRDKYKEDRDTHLTTEPQGLSVRVYVLSCFSRVWLFATLWTVACQAPLSTGTLQARIYWSGLPCPPPEDLPDPGTEPRSPALQVDSLPFAPQGKSRPVKARDYNPTWVTAWLTQGGQCFPNE